MNKGFSLVELIVVIAIMAILVGVAVPTYAAYIGKANNGVDRQYVDEVDRAIEALLIDPDVTAPKSFTITISGTGNSIAYTSETEGTDGFITALTAIIPPAELKGDAATASLTFTISDYSCETNLETLITAANAD